MKIFNFLKWDGFKAVYNEYIYIWDILIKNENKEKAYARRQKRHRYIEQSVGLCGRGRGWDDLGEWQRHVYYHV